MTHAHIPTLVCGVPETRNTERTVSFPTLEDARQFALRNAGRLFWLRDNLWAFENYGRRTAEQIIA